MGADSAAVLGASGDFVCNWKGADLAGECGSTKGEHIDHARYLSWLRLGLAFLRVNFPVPAGCRLGLTWFQYIGGPFPAIALVWDEDVPAGVTEAAYAMEQAMDEFNRAVDWRALSVLLDGHNSASESQFEKPMK